MRHPKLIAGNIIFNIVLVFMFLSHNACCQMQEQDLVYTYSASDTVPKFPGGLVKFYDFVDSVLQYPKAAKRAHVAGRVLVEFIVTSSGKVMQESVNVLKGINPLLDNEAIRVVRLSPDWIPAKSKNTGNPMDLKLVLPIVFRPLANRPIGAPAHGESYAEIMISKNAFVRNLQALAMGDSVFITFKEKNLESRQRSAWILPDGHVYEDSISELRDKVLCAITNSHTRFYCLDAKNNKLLLYSILHNPGIHQHSLEEPIEIPGRFLGSYKEGDKLFLVCAEQKEQVVKIIGIHNGKLYNEKRFVLAHNIFKNGKSAVQFIEQGNYVHAEQAMVKCKIFKNNDGIFVVLDEPYVPTVRDPNEPQKTEPPFYATIAMWLDLDKQKVISEMYPEESKNNFTSFVFDKYVFRISGRDLQVFEFGKGGLIKTIHFNEANFPRRKYLRTGDTKTVVRLSKTKGISGNYIIVGSVDPEIIINIGYAFKPPQAFPVFTGLGLPGLLLTLVGAATLQISEGTLSKSYNYLHGTLDSGLDCDLIPFPNRLADEYEADLATYGVGFQFKGYLKCDRGLYGIYIRKNSDVLQVVKFEDAIRKI